MNDEQAKALRASFGTDAVDRKPQPLNKNAQKGRCGECGGWHGLPAIHLDYVGHAAATDRMLQVDPEWTWEPVPDPAAQGLPMAPGGMWIRLTIAGVTRLGYGDADGKSGGNAVKETIGDALRNAGMRFGIGLDLWRKEDKGRGQVEHDDPPPIQQPEQPAARPDGPLRKALGADISRLGTVVLGRSQAELYAQFARTYGTTVVEANTDQLERFRNALRDEAAEAQLAKHEPAGDDPAPPEGEQG